MKLHLFYFFALFLFGFSCQKKEEQSTFFLKKYDKIRLISYHKPRDIYNSPHQPKIENDTIEIPNIHCIDNILLKPDSSKKIYEILLSNEQNCLLADCYRPQHMLLFYKQNKLLGFYEFCNSCGGNASQNIKMPPFCSSKGEKMMALFEVMKLQNTGNTGM
jgi:hypothetical protein